MAVQNRYESALLIGSCRSHRQRFATEESLHELSELALSAGALVRDRLVQERDRIDPAYYLGRGKVEEIARRTAAQEVNLLIFDDDLSPGQKNKIVEVTRCKVVDRTELILDIFAQRARTREGKLQVELAQLFYLLPRLTGKGIELSRLGGGIGTRGPGETKLETDRRALRKRIGKINEEIEKIRTHRSLHRAKRKSVPIPTVAVVGYTNAGKSSLFNALTRAHAVSSRRMFSTLDPLIRRLRLPGAQELLLSDTVGFIRKLPTHLVAAFRATLEEVQQADLILHVVDLSRENFRDQMKAVLEVLGKLEVLSLPRIEVFNKIDLLNSHQLRMDFSDLSDQPIFVSALTGQGIPQLVREIGRVLDRGVQRAVLRIPYPQARLVELFHEKARILTEQYEPDHIRLEVQAPRILLLKHREFLQPGTTSERSSSGEGRGGR
ncbi:MAG: GTPase HflX [Acidobacteria bacterium]|nr:GTPase HflX [Acidobacteriota bacterium]